MPARSRSLRRAGAALAGAVALLPAGAHLAASQTTVTEALPDLRQVTPYRISVRGFREHGRRVFRIGFASSVVNGGKGTFLIDARRRSSRSRYLVADQIVVLTDGKLRRHRRVGRMYYESNADHEHFHLRDLERYRLLRSPSGRLVGHDHKTGFCPVEDYRVRRYPQPPTRIYEAGYVEDSNCDAGYPHALHVQASIQAGWADIYIPFIEGQSIDVTRLPAGSYELVHVVNPTRRLHEITTSNNYASVRLRLTWPRGHGHLPRVHVVQRCPARPRCARG